MNNCSIGLQNDSNKQFSVTEITKIVKGLINEIELFKSIQVNGEVSNLKVASNGHTYFTLKDNDSSVSTVLFKQYRENVKNEIKNGDLVTVYCSLDVYSSKGSLQLVAYNIKPIGLGNYLVNLSLLKEKLNNEGLFNPEHKRPIDKFAESIAVITAKNSAACKDITTNIFKRNPYVKIYTVYCSVQGDTSEESIINAINKANLLPVSTIILARGGGSVEDLDVFNSEKVVRCIYNSNVPVITAIGHEIDFTLSDYASDVRVSTPTGAAIAAVIDYDDLCNHINSLIENINYGIDKTILNISNYLITTKKLLINRINENIHYKELQLKSYSEMIDAKYPLKLLEKGYTITKNKDNKVILSIENVSIGDDIYTITKDGVILSKVIKKENKL